MAAKRRRGGAKAEGDAGAAIDAELERVNDLLQQEETSQKQTWQIGKRLKKLMEAHPTMATQKTMDAYFLWGTALARLASNNEDATLAEAAVDKFQQMAALAEDVDAAIGPVGYSLWASSLLIMATEHQQKDVLTQALQKFEQAVEVDGGTTFETRFQHAKALKEGGDLVRFLESEGQAEELEHRNYYRQALEICSKLESIYKHESAKEASGADASEGEADEDEDVDADDDKVLLEDFAEVKLMEAVLCGLVEDGQSGSASFSHTLELYRQARELNPENPDALIEWSNYVANKCLLGCDKHAIDWEQMIDDIESQYKTVLADMGFDMAECHEICQRKDTKQTEEPEEQEMDANVPHLLNSLGKLLVSYLRGSGSSIKPKSKKQKAKALKSPRLTHAVEVLRSAHHFHDKLGAYHLACLYAAPAFADEESCRTWLETADTYGGLEEEMQESDFATMHEKPWFHKFTQPEEQIEASDEEESEDGDDE